MAFQTPITIKQALDGIQNQKYVLPAIQREFVWKPAQVAGLFDSLMQGYPIGSFLFWKVDAQHSGDYKWYGFIRNYHQLKGSHCPVLDLPSQDLVAILDGQQRLTSLNIGLRGSHTEKEPRKWWNNPGAFPTKHLYLNLCGYAPENELGLKFDFRFLTEERASSTQDAEHRWFKVADVCAFTSGKEVHKALQSDGLGNHDLAYDVLFDLWAVVHEKQVIPYFVETEQNLDKVLNIFIRVNSAGTPLSYSDLLLSVATAQWSDVDARDAILGLVDDLNGTRGGFQLSKDLVLKSGLMLSDIPSVAFRVTNFNAVNMKTLEEKWQEIARALRLTVELFASFGFSQQNLAADSVIIPVAYYLFKRGFTNGFITSPAHRADREAIRAWVFRSLVKSGVWGSGLDTMLLALRSELQEHGSDGFPVEAVESAMRRRGKSLTFSEDEVQDLLDSRYGDKRTFALLALLYPFVDLNNVYHVDHIFPRSSFTDAKQRKAGVPEDKIAEYHDKADRLANLQLLEGPTNQSKLDKPPAEWIAQQYPDEAARRRHLDLHDIDGLPPTIVEFGRFYDARRERLSARLRRVLEITTEELGEPETAEGLTLNNG